MLWYAGPCLLNDTPEEIENFYKTAEEISKISKNIRYRCKMWGGGTTPEKYIDGIGDFGLNLLHSARVINGLNVGTEIKDCGQVSDNQEKLGRFTDYVWIAARASQNYELLSNLSWYIKELGWKEVLIKRHPGMTIDEVIGLHDICDKIYGFKPIMVERGINTFCRTNERRWMPDFQGMLRLKQERPDIAVVFDPSHACGQADDIFPMVKAANELGVDGFMLEVYNNKELTQTDKSQAIDTKEFEKIYNYIESTNKDRGEK